MNRNLMNNNEQVEVVDSLPAVAVPEAPAMVSGIAPAKLTLAQVQAKLDGKTGKRFWKNLDELAETPAFHELMQEEFPRQSMGSSSEWVDAVSRRGFLKVMGASMAMAGLAGCTKQPDEPIFAYVKQPEDLVLGKPMFFATAFPFPTGAIPVLVKTDAFRPIKIEGNPEHPMSKGKSDAFAQGTLLDLYDPDRSQHPVYRGQVSSFGKFQQEFSGAAKATKGGAGVYFLSETITSPTLAAQWKQVQSAYPQAKLVQWDPVNSDSSRVASKAAFGSYTDAQYKLEEADVILSLDADFLGGIGHPGFLPLAAGYAERHKYEESKELNRLYVVESTPTVTGFKAEHRLALKPSLIAAFAAGLASGAAPAGLDADQQKFFAILSKDLKSAAGKAVVIPGEQASPAVHAAAYALNASIGAIGKTVVYTETVNPLPSEQTADLKSLVDDMNSGKVQWLVMLGVNPIYTAPADLKFAEAFEKVPVTVHLGSHADETGSISIWHLNKAHYLESWSDARAYDGTISIIQPMIKPLYDGVSAHDVFQALLDPSKSGYDVVVENAKTYIKGDFAAGWRKALHDGWVEGTAFSPKGGSPSSSVPAVPASSDAIEVAFRADPSIYDGRFANVGWLQELPKQVTNLSWDNAALMSLRTMLALKVEEGDVIEITKGGEKVIAPVLASPGHPDGAITVHLGFGRTVEAGRVAATVGFNAYKLRSSDSLAFASDAAIKKGSGSYDLCVTKVHNIEHRGAFAQHDLEKPLSDKAGVYSLAGHEAEERGIIRYATVAEAKAKPDYAHEGASGALVNKVGYMPNGEEPGKEDTFFPEAWSYKKTDGSTRKIQNAWGMSIDLNSCVGCNACIVACYAENNIPVVGREQVKVGRNMQWLRIDTYFEGDLNAPRAHFQPMACQHCENAGCEQVCPVGATVHTPEGINTMVYNRCVGTRYCSNNCPYKVRRFNFLLYSDYDTESLKFMRNPDVTVRSRGVMEKCSYCVQRIEAAKIEADKENREIRDGDIVTACQQSCPTNAIIFGNINDPASKVAKLKAAEREYGVLADLNYRPRTTYTAGVINPNPELA
ncbi:quinol:cytochrome c oxidoreductase iron-sulfur protein precursor [Granulicella pectinivorans]|uniref:Quinol:cytochrome c oxidoreductase iron-sulfur protein n=1 Tax=Granulicella pectinivorans TaxID=474950 RepID=A0A1I6LFP9_9BACT|nr:TAT-variant-translocated molybdopterin oxidoreductase [Granulicella pectinivorans]SFS02227.1 quinol:cytochrome c oxidoreductase iron-sulfur protein precursor [Granulicella pectinivorans]